MLDVSLPQLISDYGYLAVAVGTFLEGESILLLAGFAAHRGYLDLSTVILVAMCASVFGDQLYFGLGHWHGPRLLSRFPGLARAKARVERHVLRHQNLLMLLMRFLYGLRVGGPIILGMHAVRWRRFLVFNLLGALIWAPLVAGLGYVSGGALERWLGDIQAYEGLFMLAVLLLAILVGLVRRTRTVRSTSVM